DGIAAAGERADDGEVRGEPAAEDQRRFRPLPIGEQALQAAQRRGQSRDERRGGGAGAGAPGRAGGGGAPAAGGRGGGGQAGGGVGVGGEVGVVGAGEGEGDPLGRLQVPPRAVQAAAAAVVQLVVHPGGHD